MRTIQRRKEAKNFLCFFAPLRENYFWEVLVCGQRAMGVITARGERSTIVAKVKLSFGLR